MVLPNPPKRMSEGYKLKILYLLYHEDFERPPLASGAGPLDLSRRCCP